MKPYCMWVLCLPTLWVALLNPIQWLGSSREGIARGSEQGFGRRCADSTGVEPLWKEISRVCTQARRYYARRKSATAGLRVGAFLSQICDCRAQRVKNHWCQDEKKEQFQLTFIIKGTTSMTTPASIFGWYLKGVKMNLLKSSQNDNWTNKTMILFSTNMTQM